MQLQWRTSTGLELIVTNTRFKQTDERKTTWMHPRSRHWHMIDFIITKCRYKMDVHSTRAMRGANSWTNHQMLWLSEYDKSTTGKGQVSRPSSTQQNEVPSTIGRVLSRRWIVLSPNRRRRKARQHQTRNALQHVVYNTAKTYLGRPNRKHQDLFDPNDQELQTLMSRRDKGHQRVLHTRSTKCKLLQKRTRALKSCRLVGNGGNRAAES